VLNRLKDDCMTLHSLVVGHGIVLGGRPFSNEILEVHP